jgi:hypothetical protein
MGGLKGKVMIDLVIGGGQTGADLGGWKAARKVGIATSGWMPRGFLTEAGPRPEYAVLYGAKEHESPEYPPRTEANAREADATLWFGDGDSRGFGCTMNACRKHGKPTKVIRPGGGITPGMLALWVHDGGYHVVNVAGNRESTCPGIEDRVQDFLVRAFRFPVATAPLDPKAACRCESCGEPKMPGTECFGDDQCTCGPDGGPAECCEGWGRYCCRCGADYARSQMP